jgi:hypothetical protein
MSLLVEVALEPALKLIIIIILNNFLKIYILSWYFTILMLPSYFQSKKCNPASCSAEGVAHNRFCWALVLSTRTLALNNPPVLCSMSIWGATASSNDLLR